MWAIIQLLEMDCPIQYTPNNFTNLLTCLVIRTHCFLRVSDSFEHLIRRLTRHDCATSSIFDLGIYEVFGVHGLVRHCDTLPNSGNVASFRSATEVIA